MNKKIALGILVVMATIIIIFFIVNSAKSSENTIIDNTQQEEIIEVLEDGTKFNTSKKIKETKTIDGMEITNIQLTEKNNQTVLLGRITNNTKEKKGGYAVNITMLDKDGNKVVVLVGYIKELQPGESTALNVTATLDYSNSYDFTITRK